MDDSPLNGLRAEDAAGDEPAQEHTPLEAPNDEPLEQEPQQEHSPYGNGHGKGSGIQEEPEIPAYTGNGSSAPAEGSVVQDAVVAEAGAEEEPEEVAVSAGIAPGLPSIDEMLAALAARPPEPEPEPAALATATGEAIATGEAGEIVAEGEAVDGEQPAAPVVDEWVPGEWFVVHTYSGYENKVKTSLEMRVHSMSMEERIFEIVVPMEDVMEVKSGKKQLVQKKVFPGYLLVRMDLDDDSWYVVRNTPGVTGFVGSGTKPIPLSVREVDQILQRKGVEEKPKPAPAFSAGEGVRVIAGPFANFQGVISEIDTDRSKLKVLVNIFGRETPVELGFDQVSKL